MAEFHMQPNKLIEYAKMVTMQKGCNPNTFIYRYCDHPNGQQSINVYADDSNNEELVCNVVPTKLKQWHQMCYNFNKLYNEEVEYINNSNLAAFHNDYSQNDQKLIASELIDKNTCKPAADPCQITANDFKLYIRQK